MNKAVSFNQKACNGGVGILLYDFGAFMAYRGDGMKQNKEKAMTLFKQACDWVMRMDVINIRLFNQCYKKMNRMDSEWRGWCSCWSYQNCFCWIYLIWVDRFDFRYSYWSFHRYFARNSFYFFTLFYGSSQREIPKEDKK